VRFEANRGQAPGEVRYLGRAGAMLLAATDDGLSAGGVKLEFECKGGWSAEAPAASMVHYLGARPVHASQFQRLRCVETAPGIDAVFYANANGELEYDLQVAPQADPSRVQWRTRGPRIEGGDLVAGTLRLRRPVASQEGRQVAAAYRVRGDRFGFETGPYDRSKPLLIDPVMTFGTYMGGVGGGTGEGVALDAQGNIYVTGVANTNFFPLKDAMRDYFSGSNDVFIAKFNRDRQLLWSTYLGSFADDRALDIAVDPEGAVYITGFTASLEFPVTPGAAQPMHGGGSILNGGDAFVTKIAPDGASIVWSTFYGGTGDEYARGLVVASDGSVIISGSTTSIDLPLVRALQSERDGPRDIFVAHFSANGGQLLFSTYFGGSGTDEGNGIAIDPRNHVYLSGTTTNATFPKKNEAQANYGGGTRDIVIVKIDPFAAELLYSTNWGGTGDDIARGIVADADGHAYLTGQTGSNTFPTRNRLRASGGGTEAWVLKMKPDGTDALWGTFLGGSSTEQGFGIDIDAERNVYVSGFTQSLNFPLVAPLQTAIGSPCRATPCTADWFLARFRADGQELQFSTYLGGNSADQSRAVAVRPDGAMHIIGNTQSSTFPTAGAFQPDYNGGGPNIIFLTRIEP